MMHEHFPQHAGGNPLGYLIPLILLTLLLTIYLRAVFALLRRNRNWHKWRTVSFVCGIILLALATSPYLMQFAHQDFRGHMVQHLLIGMLAPLGLVFGAPITLALKTLPVQAARKITFILGSKFFHLLSHPATAMLLNIGGMYLLYLTPLYNATFTYSFLHHFIHLHFLLAGYLFTWSIAGPDPAPRRPGFGVRVTVLFLSMAAHAYLSKFMYAYLFPLNSPHSAGQIQSGAKLMYYGGDFSELLLAIALFAVWYQKPVQSSCRVRAWGN